MTKKKNMADTERALKNNRVALALTESTVRVIGNTKRKLLSFAEKKAPGR